MLELLLFVVLYKYKAIQQEATMKQETTQNKEVKEILNVGTLGQDERIRTVVNEHIQVQVIRSDVGYIVDILDKDGGLLNTSIYLDDDLSDEQESDDLFSYSLTVDGEMTIYLLDKYTIAEVQDVADDQAETLMDEILVEMGYKDEQGNITSKTRAYLN